VTHLSRHVVQTRPVNPHTHEPLFRHRAGTGQLTHVAVRTAARWNPRLSHRTHDPLVWLMASGPHDSHNCGRKKDSKLVSPWGGTQWVFTGHGRTDVHTAVMGSSPSVVKP